MSDWATFAIHDRVEARTIVHQAAQADAQVAWTDSIGRSGSGRLVADRATLRFIVDDDQSPVGTTSLAFVLYQVPFFSTCLVSDDALVEPLLVWSADNRASMRVNPTTLLHLAWYSLDKGGMRINQAPIIEIGGRGARSFHPPGTPLPTERVFAATLSHGASFSHCMAEVCSRTSTSRGVELGLRLTAEDPAPIADLMLRTLFPQITLRRHVSPDRVLDLFKASRYLGLREGCRPSKRWLSLDADSISRDLTYVAADGQPIGHVSLTRAYRNAWLGHQIATLSNHENSIEARRSLYLSFAMLPGLLDGPGAKLVGYYDRSRPWHQIFFEEFVRSVRTPSMAAVAPLDRFERSSAPLVLDTEIPARVRVAAAADRDLASVAELARQNTPELLADALELTPSQLRSGSLHPEYEGTRWKRSREVLVLKVDGRLAGAALCEVTTRGLSLFNIMNMARFFVAGGVEPVAQRVFQHAIRVFYANHGVSDPLVVAPANTFDATLDPNVHLAETMGAIVWSTEGLRAFENYVRLRFAWLQQRESDQTSPPSRTFEPKTRRSAVGQ